MKYPRQALVAFVLLAVLVCAWMAPMDAPAARQVDAGLKRALVSFASARALHGVLSVVQGTQFSAQPLGVGVSLTPGQLLAPVNGLVKSFADFMLVASVAFGIMKVSLAMGGFWLVSAALTLTGVAWLWAYSRQHGALRWLSRLLVLLLMVRFAVPVVVLGTDVLWQQFLAADYTATQQAIAGAAGQAAKLNPADAGPGAAGGSFLERARQWLSGVTDVKAQFEAIRSAAERVTEQIVQLIVIFLLQTMVIPVLLLWALYRGLRGLLAGLTAMPRRLNFPV